MRFMSDTKTSGTVTEESSSSETAELTAEQQQMLEELRAENQKRVDRQLRLLDAKAIEPSDLVMLRLRVLTEIAIPDILKPALQRAYINELDKFLDAAEAEFNRATLTKGVQVKVPTDLRA